MSQQKGGASAADAAPGCQPSASAVPASLSGIPDAKHSPLPWALSYGFSCPGIGSSSTYAAPASAASVGIKLATPWIEGAWDNDEEAAANAEFIVRACNSHYELYAALALYVAACGNTAASVDRELVQLAWSKASAALAKARGQ